jgi:hypothetical protein
MKEPIEPISPWEMQAEVIEEVFGGFLRITNGEGKIYLETPFSSIGDADTAAIVARHAYMQGRARGMADIGSDEIASEFLNYHYPPPQEDPE